MKRGFYQSNGPGSTGSLGGDAGWRGSPCFSPALLQAVDTLPLDLCILTERLADKWVVAAVDVHSFYLAALCVVDGRFGHHMCVQFVSAAAHENLAAFDSDGSAGSGDEVAAAAAALGEAYGSVLAAAAAASGRARFSPRTPGPLLQVLPASEDVVLNWVDATPEASACFRRWLEATAPELLGAALGRGAFVSGGFSSSSGNSGGASGEAAVTARLAAAWNHTPLGVLGLRWLPTTRGLPGGGRPSAPSASPTKPAGVNWGQLSALITSRVGIGASATVCAPSSPQPAPPSSGGSGGMSDAPEASGSAYGGAVTYPGHPALAAALAAFPPSNLPPDVLEALAALTEGKPALEALLLRWTAAGGVAASGGLAVAPGLNWTPAQAVRLRAAGLPVSVRGDGGAPLPPSPLLMRPATSPAPPPHHAAASSASSGFYPLAPAMTTSFPAAASPLVGEGGGPAAAHSRGLPFASSSAAPSSGGFPLRPVASAFSSVPPPPQSMDDL